MTRLQHLKGDELQTFVEGGVQEGDRAMIESHLVACLRCRSEVEEWRSLFTALSSLPHFDPMSGFADRVLAGLHASHATAAAPWYVRAGQRAGRIVPKTTKGWALAAAFLALPVVSGSLFLAWLMSHAYVTPRTLWAFGTDRGAHALEGLGSGAISWLMKTDVIAWAVTMSVHVVQQVGMSGVGALLAGAALATCVSIWVLYRNLFRSPTREASYVSFSF
ncbi:MAG: hypothetical protein ABIS27_09745 [Longimicrobiales bacterium]